MFFCTVDTSFADLHQRVGARHRGGDSVPRPRVPDRQVHDRHAQGTHTAVRYC